MGTIQLLLLLAAFIFFGTFNLISTKATLATQEAEYEFTAYKDMFIVGRDAQTYFDSTNTFIGYTIRQRYADTPFNTLTLVETTETQFKFKSVIKINNKQINVMVTEETYQIL